MMRKAGIVPLVFNHSQIGTPSKLVLRDGEAIGFTLLIDGNVQRFVILPGGGIDVTCAARAVC